MNAVQEKSARILVVDDEHRHRDLLARRLIRRGFTVELGRNGQEALDLARALSPDLIVMDIKMPVMDGWEAVSALKADDVTASIPVIALSAFDLADERRRALEAGYNRFESKPVPFPTLIAAIEELLEEAKTSSRSS